MEKNKFGKRSQILITLFLVLVAIIASAFLVKVYIDSLTEFVDSMVISSLDRTSSSVFAWFDQKEKVLEGVVQAYRANRDDPESFFAYIQGFTEADAELIDIYYGTVESPFEGGRFVSTTGWIPDDDWDWTQRPWFLDARNSSTYIMTEPYIDAETGNMIVSLARKIEVDGRLEVIVALDIFMTTVNDVVNSEFITSNSVLNIVNANGDYLTHTADIKIQNDNYYSDFPEYQNYRNDIEQGYYFRNMNFFANSYFASIGIGNKDWYLLGKGPLSDFYNTSRGILTVSVILLALIMLFIILLSRSWKAFAKLQVASMEIESINQGLEETVENRTRDLTNILDSTEEGYLTFGESMTVDPGFSGVCREIFQKDIAGLHISDLLFPGRSDLADDQMKAFSLFFEGRSDAEVIFDLTEKQTTLNDRIISIDYKLAGEKKVLCVLKDITDSILLEEKEKKDEERNQRLLRVLQHSLFFQQFLKMADSVFSLMEIARESDRENLEELVRRVHTFKSDCGFFIFNETQDVLHEAEETLGNAILLESPVSSRELLLQIRRSYFRELKTVTDIMGEHWLENEGNIAIPQDAYYKIVDYVKKKIPGETRLLYYLEYYRKVPIAEIFSRLPYAANDLAGRLGKKIAPMSIQGGNLRVLPEVFAPLAEACIHIVNNIVDHGIEYSYEREAVQKLQEGKIELLISSDKKSVILEFRDDGRGINPREIEEKAIAKGIIQAGRKYPDSEILKLVFRDGFSTKEEASTTSGRGIGLPALYREVKSLGGTVDLRSRLGKGTIFEITIPLEAEAKRREK